MSDGIGCGLAAGAVDPETVALPRRVVVPPGPGMASPQTTVFCSMSTFWFEPTSPFALAYFALPEPLTC